MYAIEIMVQEHQKITRMLEVIRKACLDLLKGKAICYEDFEAMMDFVKNYADAHHHGKEEKLLFKAMKEELGSTGEKLIQNGMLVEHDLGRLYMRQLKEALERTKEGDETAKLDVIANAIGYTDLLKRHIQKEDEVVYQFGIRALAKETLETIEEATILFEEAASKANIQKYYEEILYKLEEKYLIKA